MNNLLIILLLLFFQSLTFAQTTDVKTLEKELKKIVQKDGKTSLKYAQKLIEIGTVYYKNNDEKSAVAQLDEAGKILDEKAKNLPESYEDRQAAKLVINSGVVSIVFIKWHFLIQKKEYKNALTLLSESNWFALSINSNNTHKILEVLSLLANDSGTTSDDFFAHWTKVYWKMDKLSDIEKMWQFLIEKRIKEFGKNSNPHISALFGMSHFYKRYGETAKYKELKEQVEQHWKAHNYEPVIIEEEEEEEEKEEGKEIFTLVEEMPRFPGCEMVEGEAKEKKSCADQQLLQFIYNTIKYPDMARENGNEGMVVISFTVMEDGIVASPTILRNVAGGCGEEALRVVLLMNELPDRWSPGRQRGKNVRVKYNLPVKFKLN